MFRQLLLPLALETFDNFAVDSKEIALSTKPIRNKANIIG